MKTLQRRLGAFMVMILITGRQVVAVVTSKSSRLGALVAVLVFVLMACGSDDSATDAGVGGDGDGGTEATSTSVADDESDDHDDEDADHDDEDEHGDEHDDEDADHDDDEHGDEHDDDDHDDDDHDDEASGGLAAHEHGVAELSVAWADGAVIVDLISPTNNIFGFEYEPSTDEDRAIVDDRIDALSQPGIIALNEEAGCVLADELSTELEFEGSHAELTASWLFTCEDEDQIRQLDVAALFAEFPNLEDIDAQWASPTDQSSAELSPSSAVLSLG